MIGRKLFLFCVYCVFMTTTAQAVPINLNDFSADSTVTVAPDGSSATIEEDASLFTVLLSNDPGLGDPEVIIAGLSVSLVFDYNFVEGGGSNNDEFEAFILNSSGVSAGPGFEFFTQTTSAGILLFDLSGLIAEPFIGLQFQLSALPGDVDLNSSVTISNVRLESVGVIPEPATVLLFAVGAISIVIRSILSRRAKRARQSA